MIKLISLCVDEDRFSRVEVLEFKGLEELVLWDWVGNLFDGYMGKLLCVKDRDGKSVDDVVDELGKSYEDEEDGVRGWIGNVRKFKKLCEENDGWCLYGVWSVEYDGNVSVIVCDEWDKKRMLDGKKMSKVIDCVGKMRNDVWEVLYGGGG